MDEGLSSAGGVRRARTPGFTARQSGDAAGVWHEIAEYADGRVGVAIGSCADRSSERLVREAISARLRDGADPAAALHGFESTAASVVVAVVDRSNSLLSYVSSGTATAAVAEPGQPRRPLKQTADRSALVALAPGAVVALANHSVMNSRSDGHWPASSAQVLDDLLAECVAGSGTAGILVVIYRHPPLPLELILPAEPASLAVLRRHLRSWLALTGADDETCADILLAVGEAAANSAEHAHDGTGPTGHPVQITLQATSTGDTLRFTLSDNGAWKPPNESDGHRGHGLRLMKALLDSVDVATTTDGTRIEMFKELAG